MSLFIGDTLTESSEFIKKQKFSTPPKRDHVASNFEYTNLVRVVMLIPSISVAYVLSILYHKVDALLVWLAYVWFSSDLLFHRITGLRRSTSEMYKMT